MRFERRGICQVGQAFSDLNSFNAGDGNQVAAGHGFGFVAFEPAEGVQLRDARGLDRAGKLGDAHIGPAAQRAIENAPNGDAPKEIAVIQIHHLRLQHSVGIALWRRNRRDNGFKQRLEIRRAVVQLAVRDAGLGIRVQHREIELVLGSLQINEQIVNFIEHGGGARVGPVDLVEDDDGEQLGLERLLQDVTRLRQRAFARVHQKEHAIHHFQGALDFPAEITVAGRIHDIDFRVFVKQRRIFCQNGDTAFALEVVRVHHARYDHLVVSKHAALVQHGVHQRGFAVVDVGDDGDIANLWHGILTFFSVSVVVSAPVCGPAAAGPPEETLDHKEPQVRTCSPPRSIPRGITSASEALRIPHPFPSRHPRTG